MVITKDIALFKANILNSKPILSIDYGKRNIGIAISDEKKTISLPWYTIKSSGLKSTLLIIQKILKSKNVSGTIIGWPTLSFTSKANKLVPDIMFLAENLASEINPILLYDESFTTLQAIEELRYHNFPKSLQEKLNDQISASIILEEVLSQIR